MGGVDLRASKLRGQLRSCCETKFWKSNLGEQRRKKRGKRMGVRRALWLWKYLLAKFSILSRIQETAAKLREPLPFCAFSNLR